MPTVRMGAGAAQLVLGASFACVRIDIALLRVVVRFCCVGVGRAARCNVRAAFGDMPSHRMATGVDVSARRAAATLGNGRGSKYAADCRCDDDFFHSLPLPTSCRHRLGNSPSVTNCNDEGSKTKVLKTRGDESRPPASPET